MPHSLIEFNHFESEIRYHTFTLKDAKNKASVLKLQKFAKISVVDGVSNFAPKITTKKTDC